MMQSGTEKLYRKISRHLLPILFVSYFINFLDRVNVGFAEISMSASLGMSAAVFGMGAGLFFIGYFFFEVPSNLALYRFGARRWIARIVFTWGIFSTMTAFIRHEHHFYILRFLLGAAEAGFFPGLILYLTWWYPSAMRARIVASFLTAIAVAGILGGPISGWIMEYFDGHWGLEDWRWMFLLEGLPCFLVAVWIWMCLPDGPHDASWLTEEEKHTVTSIIGQEREVRNQQGAPEHAWSIFRSPKVWKLCVLYFLQAMGLYTVAFWLPFLIKQFGLTSPLHIGLLSAIPWMGAIVLMFAIGASSDRCGERKWHAVFAATLGSIGFALGGINTNLTGDLIFMAFGAGGVLALIAITWSFPAALLNGAAAASGIALINSFGNLGGFASPVLIGNIITRTGNQSLGLYVTSGCLLLAAVMLLVFQFSPEKKHA